MDALSFGVQPEEANASRKPFISPSDFFRVPSATKKQPENASHVDARFATLGENNASSLCSIECSDCRVLTDTIVSLDAYLLPELSCAEGLEGHDCGLQLARHVGPRPRQHRTMQRLAHSSL